MPFDWEFVTLVMSWLIVPQMEVVARLPPAYIYIYTTISFLYFSLVNVRVCHCTVKNVPDGYLTLRYEIFQSFNHLKSDFEFNKPIQLVESWVKID